MAAVTLYPNGGALFVVDALRDVLESCKVNLFQNDVTPQPGTVVGDLTVADFDGYEEKTVTALLPAYIDPAGGAAAQAATIQWDHDGGETSNVVYGFYVKETGGALILVGRFENPIPMANLGDSIPLDVKLAFRN